MQCISRQTSGADGWILQRQALLQRREQRSLILLLRMRTLGTAISWLSAVAPVLPTFLPSLTCDVHLFEVHTIFVLTRDTFSQPCLLARHTSFVLYGVDESIERLEVLGNGMLLQSLRILKHFAIAVWMHACRGMCSLVVGQ